KTFTVSVISDGLMNDGMFKVGGNTTATYVSNLQRLTGRLGAHSHVTIEESTTLLGARRSPYDAAVTPPKTHAHTHLPPAPPPTPRPGPGRTSRHTDGRHQPRARHLRHRLLHRCLQLHHRQRPLPRNRTPRPLLHHRLHHYLLPHYRQYSLGARNSRHKNLRN